MILKKRRLERPPISSPFSAPHVTSKTALILVTGQIDNLMELILLLLLLFFEMSIIGILNPWI